MNFSDINRRRNLTLLIYTVFFIAIGLYFAFSHSGYYGHKSPQRLFDLVEIKIWLVLSVLMAILIHYADYKRPVKFWGWILTMSVYFLVLYALLYKGTDYGLNGQWGDNGNRLALVAKFRDYSSVFQDWYFKNLPSFYPPLWFYISGKLAWLTDVEAYKTIKLGYFVLYALYPAGLYFVWSRLISKPAAFMIVFITIFFRDLRNDYVCYEQVAAGFFIPWWLYFVENIKAGVRKSLRWYLWGGFLGALIFMTFYYWFFIGLLAIILGIIMKMTLGIGNGNIVKCFKNKTIILSAVALFSAIYWLPLLISILKYGGSSMQNRWFNAGYLNFNLPFFNFSLGGVVSLIGLFYLLLRRHTKLNRSYIVILMAMMGLFLIERFLNLFDMAIQTRKLAELYPIFLAVPSGLGLVFFYKALLRRRYYWRRAAWPIFAIAIFFIGNNHTQFMSDKMWENAADNRVPVQDLAIFRTVECGGKVFLTPHYLEAVYIPYYMFICPNGATAHTAARYDQRIDFLRFLARLGDPAQVAYLLKANCFDTVDYFYLPVDTTAKSAYYIVRPLYFPANNIDLRIDFPLRTTIESEYFVQKHKAGLYEIKLPKSGVVSLFASNLDSSSDETTLRNYNNLILTASFLPEPAADSLQPYIDLLRNRLEKSIAFQPLFKFNNSVELTDLKIAPGTESGPQLRVVIRAGERFLEPYKIFIHAVPEDATLPSGLPGSAQFINLDINPTPAAPAWINGEYLCFERAADLKPGKYRLEMGLFNNQSGRLKRVFKSPPIEVAPGP